MTSRALVVAWLAIAACSRSSATSDPPSATPAIDLPVRGGIDLPGEPNGIWWDAKGQALIVTDETQHRVARWDGARFTTVAELPTSKGLGGLVGLTDGRLVVTSLGFGTAGTVFVIAPDGRVSEVPGLDPARRRIGLAVAPDDTLYVTYFTKGPGAQQGAIARLDLATGETAIVETGLIKPVGIAASATTLYVGDQHHGTLTAYTRKDPTHTAVLVRSLDDPDLLALLPDDALVVASKRGVVYRVLPSGESKVIAKGLEQVRGIAYDPVTRRLFVAERSVATSSHKLHVLRLDGP